MYFTLSLFFILSFFASIFASPYPEGNGAALYAGAILPGKMFGIELHNITNLESTKAYNETSQKVDAVVVASSQINALRINYGINDWLTFQIGAPYVLKNKRTLVPSVMNAQLIDEVLDNISESFKALYGKKSSTARAAIEEGLTFQGLWDRCQTVSLNNCTNMSASYSLDGNGWADANELMSDINSGLNSGGAPGYGGSLTDSIKPYTTTYIDGNMPTFISRYDQEDGDTGLGDLEFGVLGQLIGPTGYLSNDIGIPLALATGFGFRLPTGSFKNVPYGYYPTGDGSMDAAIRIAIDYNPWPGVIISWVNDFQKALTKPKRKEFDPSNSLKSLSTDATYEYTGTKNNGFFRINFGFASYVESLRWFALGFEYFYDKKHKTKITSSSGSVTEDAMTPSISQMKYNAFVDLKAYRIPIDLQFQYFQTTSGTNQMVYNDGIYVKLRAFY